MVLDQLFYVRKAVGQGGSPLSIYKLRTMVPDAQSQFEVLTKNGVDGRGCPLHDPRITPLGKILRRYWIDELPQLLHVARGELDLVGIRPRSNTEWDVLPAEHKKRALQFKPALMGIQYCGKLDTLDDLLRTETEYLEAREREPLKTQLQYFGKIVYAIVIEGVRSR